MLINIILLLIIQTLYVQTSMILAPMLHTLISIKGIQLIDMSIKENMSRLKQYIAELAMKADTDIRVMRNTSDRYEVSIFLRTISHLSYMETMDHIA